jgi:hypothetical protein
VIPILQALLEATILIFLLEKDPEAFNQHSNHKAFLIYIVDILWP